MKKNFGIFVSKLTDETLMLPIHA